MPVSADALIDRRRMKRRITFWRVASLLLLAAFLLAVLWAAGAFEAFGKRSSDHIARVEISGVITNDRPMLELLEKLGEKESVKAVILDMSSPGGSTVGGEAIFEAVRTLAGEKPVVTTVGTLAASAGYMIASASDHIVARRSSIVGSIGVYFQYASARELLDKIGVELGMVKSSPLKGEPAPFNEVTEAEKEMLRKLVIDSYDWFVALVAERRGMTQARVRQLADGSIYSGAQALESGLVDAIGDEETARKWLVSEKGISDDLEVIEWKPDRGVDGYLPVASARVDAALRRVASLFGLELPPGSATALREILPERLFLDGLVSMLHIESPSAATAE